LSFDHGGQDDPHMKPRVHSGGVTWSTLLLTALSLSIGWGIRGNFGHEFGAMIPGALAALAVVLLSGREDWWPRVASFAFFGALGWSFGGSMSYMQVIGYTHSGHSLSVFYGFACLFVIGFLWAAMGGAGTALPAFLSREQLAALPGPLSAVFLAWLAQDLLETHWLERDPAFRHEDPLYWFDTDWVAAWLAMCVGLARVLVRRRFDPASSLILHMATGWMLAFLILVNALGWRMTPPRGDNWAGCVGMTIGLWIWLQRNGLPGVTLASLVAGFIGGFGFAGGQLLKLFGIATGWNTNWHSALEQTYGFINGAGIAVAVGLLISRAPRLENGPSTDRWRWTQVYAVAFVLLGITFLNLRRNPSDWVKAKAFPELMYGWSVSTWFHLGYLLLSVAVIGLLARHLRHPLALVPTTWLGRGQLLYLVFLWWVVIGNFERAVVSFAPARLITEGVIFANAALATVLLLWRAGPVVAGPVAGASPLPFPLRGATVLGVLGALASILLCWGVTRTAFGDRQLPGASKHIRFGPNATVFPKPKPGQTHP
jgi:hypothetical protein